VDSITGRDEVEMDVPEALRTNLRRIDSKVERVGGSSPGDRQTFRRAVQATVVKVLLFVSLEGVAHTGLGPACVR